MARVTPLRYFGQQVRRARRAAGWTLTEFGQRIGYDPGQISRIENGKRPPTELFAQMCDRAFPDRDGWFGEFYAESRTWIATPPWFRSWVEHEQQAATLRIWQLGVLSGLLQTQEYARAILDRQPRRDRGPGARASRRAAGPPGDPGPGRPTGRLVPGGRGRAAPLRRLTRRHGRAAGPSRGASRGCRISRSR